MFVKFLQARGDSLLYVGVFCEPFAVQELHEGPKKLEITGCEIRTIRRAVSNLSAPAP